MLEDLIVELDLCSKILPTKEQFIELSESVNTGRLKNNPVIFDKEELLEMYKEIFV